MGSSRSALAYFFSFFPSIISTIPTVQTYHMRIPRRFGARYRTGGVQRFQSQPFWGGQIILVAILLSSFTPI